MIEILIALVAVTLISVLAANQDWSLLSDFIAPIFASLGFVSLLAYSILAWHYFASEHKANIINREFGVNYTQEEVFYAESVIDTIREIQRKRIEVNGDIMNKEKQP